MAVVGAIEDRRRKIRALLSSIKRRPPTTQFHHEMMTYAYVLTYATIEFMIETMIRDWYTAARQKHTSAQYIGRKSVERLLDHGMAAIDGRLCDFNSPGYSQICRLVETIFGKSVETRFKSRVAASTTNTQDLVARLERIKMVRGALYHGTSFTSDIRPNIHELSDDFDFIYKHLIINVRKVIPRS